MRPDSTAPYKLIGVAGLIAASGWAASTASTTVSVPTPECELASRLHVEKGVTDTPDDLPAISPAASVVCRFEADRPALPPLRAASPAFPPLFVAPKNGPPLRGHDS